MAGWTSWSSLESLIPGRAAPLRYERVSAGPGSREAPQDKPTLGRLVSLGDVGRQALIEARSVPAEADRVEGCPEAAPQALPLAQPAALPHHLLPVGGDHGLGGFVLGEDAVVALAGEPAGPGEDPRLGRSRGVHPDRDAEVTGMVDQLDPGPGHP